MNRGVITGDIVGSTKIDLPNREIVLISLDKTVADANQYLQEAKDKIISQVFRGDSFQMIVPKAQHALRLAILIRLGLILIKNTYTYKGTPKAAKWDARVSVGIGTLEYLNDNILLSDGEAFRYSGRAFDKLKKSRLIIQTPWKLWNEEFSVECSLADTIIKGLSSKQAEIAYHYLLQKTTQKKLSDQLGIEPQSISKSLSYGGNALRNFIERYETIIEKQDD